jgi:hypothetical protein
VVIPSKAQDIVYNKDYFAISLVQGWYSAKHSFLQNLLSQDSKASILLGWKASFFDAKSVEDNRTYSNTDLKSNIQKSWGINPRFFDRLPGDVSLDITTKIGIDRRGTLGSILSALDDSKSVLPADVVASPVLGYAKAVDGIFRALFGTDKTKYPFLWEGSLKAQSPAIKNGQMKEHYIVLISPRKADDAAYKELDVSKLKFDDTRQRLFYNDKEVTDWSFAVFYVHKEDPYDIALLMSDSEAPWAVLGENVFRSIPVGDATDAAQLKTLAKSLKEQLDNEAVLLKRELRFSALSRAVALSSLAKRSYMKIQERCNTLTIDAATCPIDDLKQVAENAYNKFGLPVTEKTNIELLAKPVEGKLFLNK